MRRRLGYSAREREGREVGAKRVGGFAAPKSLVSTEKAQEPWNGEKRMLILAESRFSRSKPQGQWRETRKTAC